MKNWLFKLTDNSPLIIFRIIFGLLVCLECWGAIATGWITRTLVEPNFTFNFIGFNFLQPLPGNGMYYYYFVMGSLGVCIMLGYRYLISCITFSILWAGVYFMQKSSYNNHYYLLWLLSLLMSVLPANKDLSLDTKLGHTTPNSTMPNWCSFIIIAQLTIVYTYASIAKWYPDWLNYSVAENLMKGKANYPIIGQLLQQRWTHIIITYTGIFYDLLIIPALLYKPTRKIAFYLSVFFHLYNSIVLQIGIFPYLALAFSLFFFPAHKIRTWFFPKEKKESVVIPSHSKINYVTLSLISLWLFIQISLPLRHWFIKGNVLWTEEGHRLSWRMMLRSKSGYNIFTIKHKNNDISERINLNDYLTNKQISAMTGKPDMIWQFSQHLKKEYQLQGHDIEVYITNSTSVNNSNRKSIINPNIDLAAVKWNYWGHNQWITID